MTRLEALEAVAAAARPYAYHGADNNRLLKALDALDALPAEPQPQGETVEVSAAVSWNAENAEWYVAGFPGGEKRRNDSSPYWRHIATITASVPLPTIPIIPATVTLERGE